MQVLVHAIELLIASGVARGQLHYLDAEGLQRALFFAYPQRPTPVDPGLILLSVGLSNVPIWGDLYDLYSGVTGYDPITKQYLAGWERLTNILGVIPFPGVTGSNIRYGVHAVESLIDNGDELAQFIGTGCRINSFSEETPVATDEGAVPIGEIDVGDRVLAWNELTDTTGYSAVSATFSHVDATIVELTIDGETLETTADHPFYVVDSAPWLALGETQGRWVDAGDLQMGDAVQKADGTTGVVVAVQVVAQPQRMYNLTVADAHTFFVGDGEWLVHNAGKNCTKLLGAYGGSGGGHHIFAKKAFEGHSNYDPKQALALSNEWMQASGWDHSAMTARQQQLFRELAANGLPNTLLEHKRIALEALSAGGVPADLADWMVQLSVTQLQGWGVTPMKIPWIK